MRRRNFLLMLSSSMVAPALESSISAAAAVPRDEADQPLAPMASSLSGFDLSKVPFSCAGSYFTIGLPSNSVGDRRLLIQTISKSVVPTCGPAGRDSFNIFEIALLVDGAEVPYTSIGTANAVEMKAAGASASVEFFDTNTFFFRAQNCALQLRSPRSMSWAYLPAPGRLRAYDFLSQQHIELGVGSGGSLTYERQADSKDRGGDRMLLSGSQGEVQALLRMTADEQRFTPNFADLDAAIAARRSELLAWMKDPPAVEAEYAQAAEMGWFLFWNLQVAPIGHYTRQTILSSKRVMSQIWSWDNCFNALAVAQTHNQLAWEQVFVVFDQQRPSGLLPDAINDDHLVFGFNKPPVWGWMLDRLIAQTPAADRRGLVERAYAPIAKCHRWWFDWRDLARDGIPFYMNGNDSGWDNSTIFDEGWPVQSPDLTAWLILQAEQLAKMAAMLEFNSEAADWKAESTRLLDLFLKTFVRGDELVCRTLTPNGLREGKSTSLLTRIPIVLGKRLPQAVSRRMIQDLGDETTFLSPAGPASESLGSPKYEPNGYWRGPVWGPSTYLIYDGLVANGADSLAREVARRYCKTCARSATFSENYNAKTGEGQYDSGMTWSAAEFLLLASDMRTRADGTRQAHTGASSRAPGLHPALEALQ